MKVTSTNHPKRQSLIEENNTLRDKLNRAQKTLEACGKSTNIDEIKKLINNTLAEIKNDKI